MTDYIDTATWHTYDDVLIMPRYSEVASRKHCDTRVWLHCRQTEWSWGFDIPVISANMDTITGVTMADKMELHGALGIIHRYMPVENTKKIMANTPSRLVLSVGSVDTDKERIDAIIKYAVEPCGPDEYTMPVAICVDMAHGHSKQMKETLQYIRLQGFLDLVIAGNVATKQAVKDLMSWGADVIKVGIGPGSVCTTRTKTGVGVPQFEAVKECASVRDAQIIADGGFKNAGDIAKAIGAGAIMCMTGSLFAGTDWTEGWDNESVFLDYRGMASPEARKAYQGKFSNAEGVAINVVNRGIGSSLEVLNNIHEGLRSAMSYVGALNITEFQEKCTFIIVSNTTQNENGIRP